MSRIKVVVLGLLAAFAVSAVASASASAAECKIEANKKFILCLGEPLVLTEGTLTIHIKTDPETTSELSVASGVKLLSKTILEALGSLTSLFPPTTDNVTIQGIALHFTGVIVDGVEHCKVSEELVKTELLLGRIESRLHVLFQPVSGKLFAVVKIENSGGTCISAGTFNITVAKEPGGVLCTDTAIETTKPEHLFECESHELLFGEEAAKFKGSFLVTVLSGGVAAKWAVIEGK